MRPSKYATSGLQYNFSTSKEATSGFVMIKKCRGLMVCAARPPGCHCAAFAALIALLDYNSSGVRKGGPICK